MMKNLNTLGAVTVGAIVLSVFYAVSVHDRSVDISMDTGEGQSVHHIVNNDRSEFTLKDDDRTIKAKWRGDFELDDLGTNIIDVERRLEIEIKEDGVTERIEFEHEGDNLAKTYYLDGKEQEAGPETDKAISALITKFLRISGLKAEDRVTALLKSKGPAAVLEEMAHLKGDYAVRRYTVALTEQADLSADNITALAGILARMESDHDLRLALSAVLEHETISADMTPVLLDAAKSIESDHDMRKLLEAFTKGALSEDAMDIALGFYERLESDHDLRQAADAFLSNGALTLPQTARLLTIAADKIDSDHDMRLILSESAPMFSKDENVTRAWLQAFDAIESSHDQRLALESIADYIDGEPELIAAYHTAAAKIESDHERASALEAIGD